MIIGNASSFAVESGITKAYARESLRALGYFVLHIGGKQYGKHASDATSLDICVERIVARLQWRGTYNVSFGESDAGIIADSYRDAIYAPDQEDKQFFGIPQAEFVRLFTAQGMEMAPDGSQAFDDRSHVLQFDVAGRVRLIGFKSAKLGYHYEPGTLSDMWLSADEFYSILEKWLNAFEAEWAASPKVWDQP